MKAFVTSSYSYGMPNESSDIDLVVLVSEADFNRLNSFEHKGTEYIQHDENYGKVLMKSLRFGKLNLLMTTDQKAYDCWRIATKKLKKQKPVSREFACKLMAQLRSEML